MSKDTLNKALLESYIKQGLSAQQIADKRGVHVGVIGRIGRKYGVEWNGASLCNKGDRNPAKRKDVIERISNSVKERWQEGAYDKRINGMLGLFRESHHNWKEKIHKPLFLAEKKYSDYLSQYEDISICRRCGKKKKMNIHHIDEDRRNFMPSNLESLCVPCHASYHYKLQRQPFITISKQFTFAAAHRLPNYKGVCNNWHGHEWKLEVVLKKRIDKETGMALDFSILKQLTALFIIDKLDHSIINDIMENPTAENMLVWIWDTLMFEAHLKGIEKIILWETPTSKAVLTKQEMLSMICDRLREDDQC